MVWQNPRQNLNISLCSSPRCLVWQIHRSSHIYQSWITAPWPSVFRHAVKSFVPTYPHCCWWSLIRLTKRTCEAGLFVVDCRCAIVHCSWSYIDSDPAVRPPCCEKSLLIWTNAHITFLVCYSKWWNYYISVVISLNVVTVLLRSFQSALRASGQSCAQCPSFLHSLHFVQLENSCSLVAHSPHFHFPWYPLFFLLVQFGFAGAALVLALICTTASCISLSPFTFAALSFFVSSCSSACTACANVVVKRPLCHSM